MRTDVRTNARPDSGHGRPTVDVALCVPAHLASVAEVRDVLARTLDAGGWPEEPTHDLALAVTEAVGNAIEHGSRPGAPVEVALSVSPHAVHVRVADAGRPDTRTPVATPDPPAESSVRGRGRLIMRALADDIEERPAGGGTQVSLAFRRPARASPARSSG